MKSHIQRLEGKAVMKQMKGFTLLEVLLAIVIFVIGMLALAHLQTNLTRSSTDANTRTVAANVGEELLETLRSFRRVSTDPDGVLFAFADIDDAYVDRTVPRGGIDYTVTADVKGYNFNSDKTAVTEIDPAVKGAVYDFKVVDLTVAWDNNQEFQVDEDTQITRADMGTGTIQMSSLIPSIPTLTTAKVAARDLDALGNVPVDYTPGQRPDIIAIALDNNKFKESTTPQPDVIRGGELVETWFDVITYLGQSDAQFLRREEFLVVSCQCELRKPSGSDKTGFLPTVWNGESYTEGEWVSKTYGASASNQNSAYCDVCCRDHHDMTGASADEMYDPARDWTAESTSVSGDHKHFTRGKKGGLIEATGTGDKYVEACRMVRKDGFMRVAQDFRQEGFIAFPAGYLDADSGAAEYSDYVTKAVKDFYDRDRDALTTPDGTESPNHNPVAWSFTFPASGTANPTTLPTADAADSQQLRGRGIYIDHVSAEAKAVIDCVIDAPGACADAPGVTNYLEVFPFFEVQTTWLSWWKEDSAGDPVSVSDEAIETDNQHSRGLALKTGTEPVLVTVNPYMHRGNAGLAVIDPIDPLEVDVLEATAMYDLFISANGGVAPSGSNGYTWTGTFVSSVDGVNAADATLTNGDFTNCQRAPVSVSCTTEFAQAGSLTISGYFKADTSLWICVDGLTGAVVTNGDPAAVTKSATISWTGSTAGVEDAVVSIESSACTP
jgi:prepilin-type N-terminal cleavage/methylation domain-containing protein